VVVDPVSTDRRSDVVPGQDPRTIAAFHRTDGNTGDYRRSADLIIKDVPSFLDDDLVTGPRMNLDSDLISHRSRRNKQSRFLAKYFSRAFLQTIYRRILSIHIVADLGRGHRPPHGIRGFRYCIAAKIYHRLF
jgi:hypothetical protein